MGKRADDWFGGSFGKATRDRAYVEDPDNDALGASVMNEMEGTVNLVS